MKRISCKSISIDISNGYTTTVIRVDVFEVVELGGLGKCIIETEARFSRRNLMEEGSGLIVRGLARRF